MVRASASIQRKPTPAPFQTKSEASDTLMVGPESLEGVSEPGISEQSRNFQVRPLSQSFSPSAVPNKLKSALSFPSSKTETEQSKKILDSIKVSRLCVQAYRFFYV